MCWLIKLDFILYFLLEEASKSRGGALKYESDVQVPTGERK